jgi:MarR family 2-MHQ and catechol resistance regulon transcriptional repressor
MTVDESSDAPGYDPKARRIAESYRAAFPNVDQQALETHLGIAATGGLMSNALVDHLAEAGFDITRPRFTVLRMLYLAPDRRLPQSEIAHQMSVSGANVTQLIDALEREGWVQRVVNPADKRVTFAQLTPEGEERCSRLVPAMIDFMEASCGPLTQEERVQLSALLAKVRRFLEARNQE